MWLAVTKTRGLTWIGPPPNLKPKSRSIGDLMSTGMDKDRTDANQIFPVELPERLRRVLKSRAMSDADINALLTNTKSTNGATKTNASTESIKPSAARSLEEATFSQVIQSLSRLARFRKLSSATESSEWPEEEKPDEIREALFRAAITQSGELFERFRKTESRRLRRKVQLWRDTVRERDGGPSTSTTIATFTASEELATNSLDQSSEALKLGEIIGSNDAGPGNFSSPIATAIPSSSIPDSSAGTILDTRPATAAKDTIADEHTDEYDANVDARNVDPCLLYIGHLDPQFESKELVRAFAKFGEILAACVVCTHKVGKSKTHAVVKFRRPDQGVFSVTFHLILYYIMFWLEFEDGLGSSMSWPFNEGCLYILL
ncbi:hypothetical protein BDP27DRAFT_854288 [Rhodocollybia butyracea]|uniref:RRM domain-containing protein n=1 Tax=Rhodocollybia butyracea TaxID=206335 RepID=A0A9P5PTX4_9AGAR|nr:hypothetical protein BDP27DRAFT_854288 [Rhodocollybia butyracea]